MARRRWNVLVPTVVGMAALVTACTSSGGGAKTSSAAQGGTASTGVASGASSGAPTTSTKPKPSVYPTLTPASVPATGQRTRPPISLKSTGSFSKAVTGSITAVRSVTVKATVPGDVSGPSLAVTIRIVNGSGKSIALGNAVVNLAYGQAQTPASPVNASPTQPFKGNLAAGKAASGVYVFNVPKTAQAGSLTIQVSYSPAAAVVTFRR